MNDESLDDQSRATIRQGLERNDPWLAELVRCGDAGNSINETSEFNSKEQTNSDYSTSNGCSETNDDSPEADSDCSDGERIDALADIICGAGEECAGALLVLMGMIANSGQPEVLAHTVKHLALTRCVELNVFGMVDAQIAEVERQLSAK